MAGGCGGLYWEEMEMMDEIRRVPILGADGMEAMNRENN